MIRTGRMWVARREEIEEAARKVLRDHGLMNVVVDPVKLAHALGARVFNAKFGEGHVQGLVARRQGTTQVYVETDDPPYRKRFTIAHEIGHLVLHLGPGDGEIVDTADAFRTETDPDAAWTAERRREWEANVFAAALLMEADLVRTKWMEIQSLEGMAEWFQVSRQAMALRLGFLGLQE